MGTKHLTEADRLQVRALFFNTGLPKARICQITGFSLNQVKLAIRERTPKPRSGRPPRRRMGAAGTVPVPFDIGGVVAEGAVVADEHASGGHGGLVGNSSLVMPRLSVVALPESGVRQASEWVPLLQTHNQEQQLQQQSQHDPHEQQGHSQLKWDTTTGFSPQHLYYSSWPPPDPTTRTDSTFTSVGPSDMSSSDTQLLSAPTTALLRRLSETVGSLGIPSPSAASMTDFVQGRRCSISCSAESSGRTSDGYEFSSSSSASSATSYPSTPYSHMPSSSSLGGGFSLPSILTSATGM
ncbi:hypothetical protein SEPCBS57363_000640 [Sporothrix epigloea]|uniref:Uncharacterized protein n=1 Tax=Sporothrix epigloea TaxID=1892477 RepID=A0ABP0D9L3_9PEZI